MYGELINGRASRNIHRYRGGDQLILIDIYQAIAYHCFNLIFVRLLA